MSININVIAKETIVELTKRNLLLTPENYSEVFDEVAKKYGRTTQNIDKIQGYISKLNPTLAQDVKGRNVKSLEELVVFLISKANGIKEDNSDKKLIINYNIICKKLLKILSNLPNKATKNLSEEALNKLNNSSLKTLEELKKDWIRVDDDLLELNNKIQHLGLNSRDDFLEILDELSLKIERNNANAVCENLAPSVAYSLTPSIANYVNDEINQFCESINAEPQILGVKQITEQFRNLVKKRIDIDRAEISSSNKVLNDVLEQISDKIVSILSMATNSQQKVQEIKKEIESIKVEDEAMQTIKARLIAIVAMFEKEIIDLKEKTKLDADTLGDLKIKVQGLEQEINKLREETQVDFLTQLANKRQLEEQLKLAEESYERYNINYSIAFFDIDHFKFINDTYGHAAGDTILANLGNIILNNIRKLDCAGRYGGEEFMVILPHSSIDDAVKFAEKIRVLVSEQKFLCKGKTISIKVSGGVSDRRSYETQEQFIEAVDKLLYAAKNAGRNNIKSASRK
ncbi:GGDEF domain-containing protein [Campylobacter sp. RM12647]|uniref:GGDEF domain-containing protein n=1 Tax=Campylobacter sp. RM12647 TaxID=2735737 RepID=UPI001DC52BA6|nr:diguanylate cyclase [Campylobacter sp. RM12647]